MLGNEFHERNDSTASLYLPEIPPRSREISGEFVIIINAVIKKQQRFTLSLNNNCFNLEVPTFTVNIVMGCNIG